MRHTRWSDLAAIAVVLGVVVYALVRFVYDALPQLSYATPVPIGALAVAELVAARRVRMAVRHDPNAKPMAAIVIARCVALGKASSAVAAGVAGAAVGLFVWLLPDYSNVRAAGHDGRVALVVFGVAVVLLVAGVLLERSGIDPGNDQQRR